MLPVFCSVVNTFYIHPHGVSLCFRLCAADDLGIIQNNPFIFTHNSFYK